MNVKDILDFEEKACNGFVSESEIENHLEGLGDYISEKADEGMNIVLSKMKEENFVRLVREVKKALMVSMLSGQSGALLVMADMEGELDPFIHTSFLAVLAMLAEEEVI